ncbi:MAG: NHLP leader peptide family RiPP precursor [Anaerolineae bacterium]|jgi:hypothetical protein|nr:NHLP leader peptide family RiPP precursor [Anaerolineae bacterium]
MNQAKSRREIERDLVARAMTDLAFRRALMEDPKTSVEAELGRSLPERVQIKIVEESPETLYLVLPPPPFGSAGELSDEQLEAVAGGVRLNEIPLDLYYP